MFDGLPEAPLRGAVMRLNRGTLSKDLVVLEDCLAISGEASVYATDRPDMVAKLYHKPSEERQRKLEAMIANPPVDPSLRPGHVSFAWPTHLLYDDKDYFVGFAMPRIREARSATALASPKLRRKAAASGLVSGVKLGSATWFDLHATAANLAFIVGRLHAAGVVLGDLKTDNILIDRANLVSLIDCDGFQMASPDGGTLFPSTFVSEGYSAPELIGTDLSKSARDPSADLFSLAIIVHKLLLGGHPHAGRWLGGGDPPDIDHIAALGIWIHNGGSWLAPPTSAPAIEGIAPSLFSHFDQTFVPGAEDPSQRPDAEEWHEALCLAMSALVRCSTVDSHYHSAQRECFWCRTAEESGIDLFPEALADGDHIRPLAMTFERALARGDARMAVSLWRDHSALRRHRSAPDHVMRIREIGAALDAVDAWLATLTAKDLQKQREDKLLSAWRNLENTHPVLHLLEEEPPRETEISEPARKATEKVHRFLKVNQPLQDKTGATVKGRGGRRKAISKNTAPRNPQKSRRPIIGPLLAPPDKVEFVAPRDGISSGEVYGDDTDAYLTYTLRIDINAQSERVAVITITPSKPVETLPLRIVNRASGVLIAECDGVTGSAPVKVVFEAPIRPTTIALDYKAASDTVSGSAPLILHPPVKTRMIGTPSGKRNAKGPKLRDLASLGLTSKGSGASKN